MLKAKLALPRPRVLVLRMLYRVVLNTMQDGVCGCKLGLQAAFLFQLCGPRPELQAVRVGCESGMLGLGNQLLAAQQC